MKLLFVTSSLFGGNSSSRAVALELVSAFQREHPGSTIVERDVGTAPLPHITGEMVAALTAPAEARSPAQAAMVARADALIEEVESADVIVLAVPMYNFSVPSTFKAWIDHIARAGRTFRYTGDGVEGLLRGKTVFVAGSRGGVYSDGPARTLDFHEPYLRAVLGFIGLTDVHFVHAEGLNMGAGAADRGMAEARRRANALIPGALAA
jgi:FMN-dependent NADH-azoreductase